MRPTDVAARLASVRSSIDAVDRPWTHPVSIVAVTKGFGPEVVECAIGAGCVAIGENYAQELLTKRSAIESTGRRPEVHFIGRLQSNKVRLIAGLVDVWASLDRLSVVREVAKRAAGARVLIQVNATAEEGKGGCPVDDVPSLVSAAQEAGLAVEGLMTVGPTGRPPETARAGFAIVRGLVDDLGLEVCSMGMSGDLRVAVQEGSTEVRVGTALFGDRPRG